MHFIVPVKCRAQTYTLFYKVLRWFYLSSCHIMTTFEVRNLKIFWKVNMKQTVIIYENNLDCKMLRVLTHRLNLTKVDIFKEELRQFTVEYEVIIIF